MEWLRRYHSTLLQRIYHGSLHGGAEKLEALCPLWIGGGIFAALDIVLNLTNPLRPWALAALVGPGVLWALYLLFHEAKSLPAKYRRQKGVDGDASE